MSNETMRLLFATALFMSSTGVHAQEVVAGRAAVIDVVWRDGYRVAELWVETKLRADCTAYHRGPSVTYGNVGRGSGYADRSGVAMVRIEFVRGFLPDEVTFNCEQVLELR